MRAELDAPRQEYAAQIGARDAEHIRTVRRVARSSRAAGRLLIHFSLDCDHLTQRTATFREEDLASQDRGGWCARRIRGSSTFETGALGRVLSGHLGYQIEHHLFPNIPAWRYPAMAPRVQEICARHGLPYETGPLASQFASAMRQLVRFALPAAQGARRGQPLAGRTNAPPRGRRPRA